MPKGHQGDAVNDWIAMMMGIYKAITGIDPGTSVGAPLRANEGKASGPLLRFLAAAGGPLCIVMSASAWRSRVRQELRVSSAKKQN